MSQFPSLPLFTDAFIADTGHLNATETGAYLMLLMVAWRSSDCALPDDDSRLCRWARVDPRSWARIKPRVMEFWTLEDGKWTQKRLLLERDKVCKRAEAARENGKHGGRPKSLENKDGANPTGSSRVTQQKASISISKEYSETTSLHTQENARRHEWPDDYEDRIWKLYPKGADKKVSLERLRTLYRSDKLPYDVLVAGIERLVSHISDPKYAPTLDRFIRQEKWNDEYRTGPPQRPPSRGGNPFVELAFQYHQQLKEERYEPAYDDIEIIPPDRT
ncbi:DUF1376 domain-containing protein [Microvirga sp. KLBC 81]|uniref:YdaU family protein n=1 Tax=Microvirga sp. KLBC 81 TaxID=1862707 RepID=UPI00197B33CE|nr:DUF1376 domain-containing protein [Microvirga sp. KLBC 81]